MCSLFVTDPEWSFFVFCFLYYFALFFVVCCCWIFAVLVCFVFFQTRCDFSGLELYCFELLFLFKITLLCTFHLNETSAWTVIPNEATSHLEGLTFLSTCNCNSKDLKIKELPLFYERMLQSWLSLTICRVIKRHTKKTTI